MKDKSLWPTLPHPQWPLIEFLGINLQTCTGVNIKHTKTRSTDRRPSTSKCWPAQRSRAAVLKKNPKNTPTPRTIAAQRRGYSWGYKNGRTSQRWFQSDTDDATRSEHLGHIVAQNPLNSAVQWQLLSLAEHHTTWDLNVLVVRSLWEVNACLPAPSMWLHHEVKSPGRRNMVETKVDMADVLIPGTHLTGQSHWYKYCVPAGWWWTAFFLNASTKTWE